MGFGEVREKRLQKARLGHLKKAGRTCQAPGRVPRRAGEELKVGAELKVGEVFEKGQKVKVSGKSKGKGFQGTIKRHNFHRGP